MIPEIGLLALIFALCLAVLQVILPTWGLWRQQVRWQAMAREMAYGQLLLVLLAFVILAYSFWANDFSVWYVAQNSNTHLPWYYRLCAVWGAHEGSMLLWLLILSFWMAAVAKFSKHLPLAFVTRVLVVMGLLMIGFNIFILFTSNPFWRLLPNVPIQGADLNPILQDPGLIAHPPMLYMGYVGFSVAFAFAVAALWWGRLDQQWARWARPWTLLAWSFLTLGIVLGSWWSYRELGWGGWWFWDPVENASFMPWLAGTALIHTLRVTEKRDVFKAWTVLLAMTAFILSLLGTFLVRSGVLISVHAFAQDPTRGVYMLEFICAVVGVSLGLYAWRAHKIVNSGHFQLLSRESLILLGNVILFVAMVTILLGTLYPLIIEALHLPQLSVGAPYFNAVFVPLMLPLLLLMGFAPWSSWIKMRAKAVVGRVLLGLVVAGVLAWAIPEALHLSVSVLAWFGLLAAIAIIVQVVSYAGLGPISASSQSSVRRQWAMIVAHLGVAVAVIGIICASLFSQARDVSLAVGETAQVGAYRFQLQHMSPVIGSNYSGIKALVQIREAGHTVAILHPELHDFSVSHISVARTALSVSVWRDLYVALSRNLGHGRYAFRLYVKPFIRWIWWGGLIMMLGGLLAIVDIIRQKEKR